MRLQRPPRPLPFLSLTPLLLILLIHVPTNNAFTIPSTESCKQTHRSGVTGLCMNKKRQYDDFGSVPIGDDGQMSSNSNDDNGSNSSGGDNSSDGMGLAKDFYKQLKQREQQGQNTDNDNVAVVPDTVDYRVDDSGMTPQEARAQNRQSSFFSGSPREVIIGKDGVPQQVTPTRKFTGQQGGPSLFAASARSTSSSSTSSELNDPDDVMRMMGSNNPWLMRPGQALAAQAVLVAIMFVVFVYVGMTGGIGSYDNSVVLDGMDDMTLLPEPSDTEVSVWL